jgi:hypothetical protein
VPSGTGSRLTGLRSLPSSAFRALGVGVGFVVLVAGVFAGIGAWQDRGPRVDEPAAAPAPAPVPAPVPDGAPDDVPDDVPDDEADEDVPGDDATPDDPPAAGPAPRDVSVQLLNGIGADGAAGVARVRSALSDAGFRIVATSTGRAYDVTTIFYTVGFEDEAQLVGAELDVRVINPMTDLPAERRLSPSVMVHVVVGADRR